MFLFLLPWSPVQSSFSQNGGSFWDVGNRFEVLDPLRLSLFKEFGVKPRPLAPVWMRYKGRFWEELCLWALPGRVKDTLEENGITFSPLFGILSLGDLIPRYAVRWEHKYKGVTLRTFWRRHLEGLLMELLEGRVVVDLLGYRERKVVRFPKSIKRVVFEYYRSGEKLKNTQPHRAYTLRYIVEMGIGLEDLHRINFLDYRVKDVRVSGNLVTVVLHGEGRYI